MAFDSELVSKPNALAEKFEALKNMMAKPYVLEPKYTPGSITYIVDPVALGCTCPQCEALRRGIRGLGVTPLSDAEALKVFKLARARIADGWCQSQVYGPGGAVCAMGGLLFAMLGEEAMQRGGFDTATEYQMNSLVSTYMDRFANTGDVIRFNDSHTTTKADVLYEFDRAIAKLEAKLGITVPYVRPRPPFPGDAL